MTDCDMETVHPTKREVKFLHEDAIINAVAKALEKRLEGGNQSRTFYTQVTNLAHTKKRA